MKSEEYARIETAAFLTVCVVLGTLLTQLFLL